MCDVYGEGCFSQKIFPNKLNIALTLRTWIENTICEVKPKWHSNKKFWAKQLVKSVKLTV